MTKLWLKESIKIKWISILFHLHHKQWPRKHVNISRIVTRVIKKIIIICYIDYGRLNKINIFKVLFQFHEPKGVDGKCIFKLIRFGRLRLYDEQPIFSIVIAAPNSHKYQVIKKDSHKFHKYVDQLLINHHEK